MDNIQTPKTTQPVIQPSTTTPDRPQVSSGAELQWVQLQRVIGNRAALGLIGNSTLRTPHPLPAAATRRGQT